jgi:2-polyprenyl-3-methyl-5-hydroxy-6-metoxy-1,4-benzoquinol methylase
VTPGRAVRALLGPRLFRHVGRAYRGVFVDLPGAARCFAEAIPRNAMVLDVGGGDGEPLNYLLSLRPDLRVATIDRADDVGQWIAPELAARVLRCPRTGVREYRAAGHPAPDVVMTSDVLHHVPMVARRAFVAELIAAFDPAAAATLIIKDVEPGHWRAALGRWSDRYITGDRNVALIGRAEVRKLVQELEPRFACAETGLHTADAPNYALVFTRPATGGTAAFSTAAPTARTP